MGAANVSHYWEVTDFEKENTSLVEISICVLCHPVNTLDVAKGLVSLGRDLEVCFIQTSGSYQGATLPSWGRLVVSGDIFGCYHWCGRVRLASSWLETRTAAQHPRNHRTVPHDPSWFNPNLSSARVGKSWGKSLAWFCNPVVFSMLFK